MTNADEVFDGFDYLLGGTRSLDVQETRCIALRPRASRSGRSHASITSVTRTTSTEMADQALAEWKTPRGDSSCIGASRTGSTHDLSVDPVALRRLSISCRIHRRWRPRLDHHECPTRCWSHGKRSSHARWTTSHRMGCTSAGRSIAACAPLGEPPRPSSREEHRRCILCARILGQRTSTLPACSTE